MRALLLLLLTALPASATVDGWPALYDVTGVAADDVLNIRRDPDAGSEIIGTLAPDQTNIEVIRPDDDFRWGYVRSGEIMGWASLAFLARHPGQWDGQFPDFTSCGGTEPFWSLAREVGTLTLDVAFDDTPALAELVEWEAGTLNHRGRFSFASTSMVGVISREMCNDGMSELEYGLELNLVVPGEELHLQGCCSIRPRETTR